MTTGADLGQTLIPTHAGDRDGVLVDRLRAARDSAYSNRWTRTSPKPLSMEVTVAGTPRPSLLRGHSSASDRKCLGVGEFQADVHG
jgi:hypothetical protein